MQLTIKKVFTTDTDKKTGNKLTFTSKKDGKQVAYTRIGIMTAEYPDRWIGSMATNTNDPVLQIKEGQTIEATVTESGNFLNFKLPNRLDLLEARVAVLEDQARGGAKYHNTPPTRKDAEIVESDYPDFNL